MEKLSVDKTKKVKHIKRGRKPSKLNTDLMKLDLGQSIRFKPSEWPFKSTIPAYLRYFMLEHSRKFSLRTDVDGLKVIIRTK